MLLQGAVVVGLDNVSLGLEMGLDDLLTKHAIVVPSTSSSSSASTTSSSPINKYHFIRLDRQVRNLNQSYLVWMRSILLVMRGRGQSAEARPRHRRSHRRRAAAAHLEEHRI